MLTSSSALPLRILVAPDSFKGSLTADAAAAHIAAGLTEAFGTDAEIRLLPVADGGEGTLDVLVSATTARVIEVPTTDALGRDRVGCIAMLPSGRAIIEAAEANGLPHVADAPLRAVDADSAGVGVLVRAALDAGATELVLTVGGSATTDGGVGLLRALGARFLDAHGRELRPGGGSLIDLATIDLDGLDPRASAARWRIACDVTNPLVGDDGAAAVFGPQKGASPHDVAALDDGLDRLASVVSAETGVDMRSVVGGGAAGGIPAALHAVFGARLEPGMELVAEAISLDEAIRASDLVITGEGALDAQSLRGKAPGAIAAIAREAGIPVVVIAGRVALSVDELRSAGIAAAVPIADAPAELDDLRARAGELVHAAAQRVAALIAVGLRAERRSTPTTAPVPPPTPHPRD
ncbi:glycerate kinase [Microcella alkaliphila]|uniref:Glycerate kinase n=1 Tax=Microcella alkaliphila TaxID=279828 RepID=A0A4Q7TQ79_9MICO|nr:glycerate kinase [Microcella alkaliphila]RZT62240.1 glycerate kinase [Microcella alkaliphila]